MKSKNKHFPVRKQLLIRKGSQGENRKKDDKSRTLVVILKCKYMQSSAYSEPVYGAR